MYRRQKLPQIYEEWAACCANPDRFKTISGRAGLVMVETQNMAQWLECLQFEQDVRNALVEHCKIFGPSSTMIRFVFDGKMQCEPVQQLLVDAYCLHAYKENYTSDPPDNCEDVRPWLTAWSRFRNRVMQKMVQMMQSSGFKQLDRELQVDTQW